MQKNATNKRQIGSIILLFLFFSFTIGASIYLAGNGTDLRREKLTFSGDSTKVSEKLEKDKEEEPSHADSPIAFPSTGTLAEVLSSFFRTFRPTTINVQPLLDVNEFMLKLISSTFIRI